MKSWRAKASLAFVFLCRAGSTCIGGAITFSTLPRFHAYTLLNVNQPYNFQRYSPGMIATFGTPQ